MLPAILREMAGNFFDFQNRVTPRRSAAAPTDGGKQPLTVTQITRQVAQVLTKQMPASVLVRGEVTDFRAASSGHLYFALKDANCKLECVVYRSDVFRLSALPENGIEVVAEGAISVYQAAGRYQLQVRRVDLVGKGALDAAFRRLCAKLEAQGLFAAERKRPLPLYPRRIVIITSLRAAGLADILKVFAAYPWLRLMIYHVPVQGEGSGQQIAAALGHINRSIDQIGGADAVIIARGGGSAQDLWGFNDEALARAIFASRLPVVTGIGHEIDVSVADLVADHHAHTPTAAAEALAASWRAAKKLTDRGQAQLNRALLAIVNEARRAMLRIERHPLFRRPLDRVNQERQRLDDRSAAITRAARHALESRGRAFGGLDHRLRLTGPAALLRHAGERLNAMDRRLATAVRLTLNHAEQRLARAQSHWQRGLPQASLLRATDRLGRADASVGRLMAAHLERQDARVRSAAGQLELLSPRAVLARGYSMTTRKRDGAVMRSPRELRPGDRIITTLADGQIESIVQDGQQPELFE